MTSRFPIFLAIIMVTLFYSCHNEEPVIADDECTEEEISIIRYFKEIALGFEVDMVTEVTRKWGSDMQLYIDGKPTDEIRKKIEATVEEINSLTTDGFSISITDDPEMANCHMFFGNVYAFEQKYPEGQGYVGQNLGLFIVFFDNVIIEGATIFIDTDRADQIQQESLVLEELTQSLGLGKDSGRYPNSIFYETAEDGGFATVYADIDKELIRLLYHPEMSVGLDRVEVTDVIKKILISERDDD